VKIAALLVATALAFGVLWLAGEQHRENCVAAGNTGCSVLPWDDGDGRKQGVSEGGRLTPYGCELRELLNDQAVTEEQVTPLPPECR
jgi:hypothetical protein